MLIDPQSGYVQNGVNAVRRAQDDEILQAFFAASATGENGTASTAFPAGQQVGVNVGGANSNMNVAKLRAANDGWASWFDLRETKLIAAEEVIPPAPVEEEIPPAPSDEGGSEAEMAPTPETAPAAEATPVAESAEPAAETQTETADDVCADTDAATASATQAELPSREFEPSYAWEGQTVAAMSHDEFETCLAELLGVASEVFQGNETAARQSVEKFISKAEADGFPVELERAHSYFAQGAQWQETWNEVATALKNAGMYLRSRERGEGLVAAVQDRMNGTGLRLIIAKADHREYGDVGPYLEQTTTQAAPASTSRPTSRRDAKRNAENGKEIRRAARQNKPTRTRNSFLREG